MPFFCINSNSVYSLSASILFKINLSYPYLGRISFSINLYFLAENKSKRLKTQAGYLKFSVLFCLLINEDYPQLLK